MQDALQKHSKSSVLQAASSRKSSGMVADCVLLAAATLLPLILFIGRLGIYADDWGVFARFRADNDKTIAECFRTFYSVPVTHSRPVMDLYEAVLFRWFGVHPLGYHLVNAVVFYASALLLYLSLRLVLEERFLALTVPVVFLLLPNYSSARFVPFAFMVGFSVAVLCLNLYAMLQAVRTPVLSLGWACTSVAALILSGLAYEVALPLFALNLFVAWGFECKKPAPDRLRRRYLLPFLVSNAVALFCVLVFKLLATMRNHGLVSVRDVLTGAFAVHFYKLGLRLPLVAAKAIFVYWNPAVFMLAVLFGVGLFCYLRRIQRSSEDAWPSWRQALWIVAFGLLVFASGISLFFVSAGSMGFTSTGVENRTAIAASLGMAIILSGSAICLGTIVPVHRRLIQSLLIALLCIGELLATCTIGSFWAVAADRQELVRNSIKHDIPSLPPHSVLLLDGVCPYIGPGIVFEGGGDMGGSLQLLYQDPTLRGDVVTPRLRVHPEGIETFIYGRSRYYPYGPNLKVYDFRRRRAWNLTDVSAAREYFGIVGPAYTFCPEGNEGDGVPIF